MNVVFTASVEIDPLSNTKNKLSSSIQPSIVQQFSEIINSNEVRRYKILIVHSPYLFLLV